MKQLENLAKWLSEDQDLEIKHYYEDNKSTFRLDREEIDTEEKDFLQFPLCLFKEAASQLRKDSHLGKLPIAGRIPINDKQLIFQYFPETYYPNKHGVSAMFYILKPEDFVKQADNGFNLKVQLRRILSAGWNDVPRTRFTQFELLCDSFSVEAPSLIDLVKDIQNDLFKEQSSQPCNAGGHLSDHFTYFQGGLEACHIILSTYDKN